MDVEPEVQEEGDDAKALASLRDEVTAARARLATLRGQTPTKRAPIVGPAKRHSGRSGLYFVGAMIGLPSLVVLIAMLVDRIRHPEQTIEPVIVLVFAAPLLLAIFLIVRVAYRGTLDGDLI